MTDRVEARKITYANVDQLLELTVRQDQVHLVAPNSVSIAQANYMPACWARGLWLAGEFIGLMTMIDVHDRHPEIADYTPANVAVLWRLMIDASHQGRGYGSQAMQLAVVSSSSASLPKLVAWTQRL